MPPRPAPNHQTTAHAASRVAATTAMHSVWRRLKCAVNRHDDESLGLDHKDEIFRCRACGRRRVQTYTLRIDRLG